MLSLEKLLKKDAGRGLEEIVQRAQDMENFAQKMRQALPPALAEQISAVNVRDGGDLVVVCASSAWAARLRFDSESLVQSARDLGAKVDRCHVRVATS